MSSHYVGLFLIPLIMLTGSCAHLKEFDMSQAPVAKKVPHVTKIHGVELKDDYRWLQNKEDQAVLDYLQAENAYAKSWFKGTRRLEDKLYKEILSYINEDFEEVPSPYGSYLYGSRTKKGLQYPIYYRIKNSKEEVYLDLNKLAKGTKFFALGASEISPNENLLAYSTDTVGFRQYKLYIKDLSTQKIQGPIAEKVGSVVWAADNKTLFYTVEDHAKRQYRVYRHELDQAAKEDTLIYEETDERFSVYLGESLDRSLIFLVSESHTTTEYRYLSSKDPQGTFHMIFPRKQNVEYSVALHGENFLIRINDQGNNFRLISTPVNKPSLKRARELVPHRKDVALEAMYVFADYCVLSERADGLERLTVLPFADPKKSYIVNFPEVTYSLSEASNNVYDTKKFRYKYTSFQTPLGTYELDLASGQSILLKEHTPPGPYDKSRYTSERIFAKAKDGTRVPISLVYRKDLFKKSSNPLHIYGYGAYGYAMSARFSASRIALLDRGFVMAIAHIRGGGEYGKTWHDKGKMKYKMNTFTDFISVTEHLINEGYGAKDKVVIEGGSAGGLLMGVVTNMRPDLYRAVLSHVPFVDMLNTMLDDDLPLTVGEYEEWGNPNEKAAFERMRSYSPYDNLEAKNYPTILLRTGLHDSQVMYWEPAKYVAKLRALKTDQNPLLFLINMNAGHGGSSGRYDAYRERAQDLVFVLKALGIEN